MRRCDFRDEKLGTASVRRLGFGHAQAARLVEFQSGYEFLGNRIADFARARTGGIAALDHETLDDTMKNGAGVKRALDHLAGLGVLPSLCAASEVYEVLYGDGHFAL